MRFRGRRGAIGRWRRNIKTRYRYATGSAHDPDKVFCIGFHKTGTTSLAAALQKLGYFTVHGDQRGSWYGADEGRTLIRMLEAGDYDLPTFRIFDAFTDNPYFTIWREIDARFHGRFILTVRDEERWIDSCVRFYKGRRIRPLRQWVFGDYADPSASAAARAAWLDGYRRHNAAVEEHFAGRSDFLTIDVTAGDGWDELCGFLDQPVPDAPFPHRNRR